MTKFARTCWGSTVGRASGSGKALALFLGLCWAVSGGAEDGVYVLEPTVVRAQHFEREVLDVPADVVLINRERIAQSTALSLPDLLQEEANLFFRSTNGRIADGEVSMRGFGENSGLRSLILVDGQPLNPTDMGGINWDQVPLEAIESVEVIRGGHNVLYGDQALTGVIKIATRRAQGTSLVLQGMLGSHNRYAASASASYGNDQWSMRVGGSHREDDGYRDLSDAWTHQAYASVAYFLPAGDEVNFNLSWSKGYQHFPGDISYDTYLSAPESAKEGLQHGESESRETAAIASLRFEGERDWGSWQVQGGYDVHNTDWTMEGLYAQNDQTGWMLRPRLQLGDASSQIILGSDYIYDKLVFTDYLDATRNIAKAEAELKEQAVGSYFLIEKEISSGLTLTSGYRHEWIRFYVDSDTYVEDQLSPVIATNRGGVGPNPNYKNPADLDENKTYDKIVEQDGYAFEFMINYRINPQWSVFTGYDRVYRYPVTDERAAYQGVELALAVSPVDAEQGNSFEAGVKYLGQQHEFYVTAYYLKMDNEIGYTEQDGLGLNINIGPVRRLGGDVAWIYKQADWGFSTRLAGVDTEMLFDDLGGQGKQVPMVANYHTTSVLWWKPWERIRLKGIHRYVGSQFQGNDFANERRKIAAYHRVDLHVDAQLTDNFRWVAGVTNVFDQLYAEAVFLDRYYPGPGRAYFTGIKFNF